MTTAASELHLAVLDHRKVAFFEQAHAQHLVDQWNKAHAGVIARDRAEGLHDAADRFTGKVETCERAHWERFGPGGLSAVWDRVPQQQRIYSRSATFVGFASRRQLNEFGPGWMPVWEFMSTFTDRPAVTQIDMRARGTVTLSVHGLEQQAVDTAFTAAVAGIQSNPNRDDHLDAGMVLLVLRGIAEDAPWRYITSELHFHTDVRAAIACGLVQEEGIRLSLTDAGRALFDRALARFPDPWPMQGDVPPALADLAAELTARYPLAGEAAA
ncbi:hypothetical protein [Streptomyces sp. bgisy154]|uniref:hypothetical protein n=1 Tax=Streptomyces sp. bgisy154 TaxID=3413794 RepID=UPI003D75FA22